MIEAACLGLAWHIDCGPGFIPAVSTVSWAWVEPAGQATPRFFSWYTGCVGSEMRFSLL